MNSFLFPEDISSPVAPAPNSLRKTTTNAKSPPIPSRAPPMVPQQQLSLSYPSPPQPSHVPPPPPLAKEKPAISVTELSIPNRQIESNLQRTKSKRSYRQAIGFSQLKDRREARAFPQAQRVVKRSEVSLPPLSPVVDEEFWRMGRYPSSPLGFTMAHVPF